MGNFLEWRWRYHEHWMELYLTFTNCTPFNNHVMINDSVVIRKIIKVIMKAHSLSDEFIGEESMMMWLVLKCWVTT